MRTADRLLGLRLLNLHQWLYERTDGRWGHQLGGRTMLLLTTTGRKSGRPRTVSLLYERDGDRMVVVGSKGGSDTPPAWLVNLKADPHVTVQLGRRRFAALARVADGAERDRLWPIMVGVWPSYARYQAQTRREIPLVIIESS